MPDECPSPPARAISPTRALQSEIVPDTFFLSVAAALPRAVGVGEVEVAVQGGRDELMLGEFLAVVGGERMDDPAHHAEPAQDGIAHIDRGPVRREEKVSETI